MKHGTAASYTRKGCRCAACVEAFQAYGRDYRRRVKENGGPLTQGTPEYRRRRAEIDRDFDALAAQFIEATELKITATARMEVALVSVINDLGHPSREIRQSTEDLVLDAIGCLYAAEAGLAAAGDWLLRTTP
jgi:hypothetical protein